MLNNLIFIVLPYAALALVLIVTPYRWYTNRLTWSAYSTQFLERKTLYWGINPWHYGIILILLAHLAGIIAPGVMKRLLGHMDALIFLESVGLGLGFLALFGSIILLLRRVNSPMLKRVTFAGDWILLFLLIAQTATGIYISLFMRWGSQWYLHTVVPYFYSLLTFKPQLEYMADFPLIFKLHAAGAFLLVALLPFTKLVHLLYQPITFLKDPPILYRWLSRSRERVG
ncbi:respiratory nitrate reductase subunit gamma [Geobacter sp.]|uniref:respiratory nitrate reductase subunit gamma n=1 Tax=Geobacter sp. TaxID=46610 RepID=UPI0026284646|nr:respiratory nitrate reductase subunit gamma [Geobacter sp.]